MSTTIATESALLVRVQALLPSLRAGERAAVVFFLYLSALAWVRHIGAGPRVLLFAIPLVIWALAAYESSRSTALTRVTRDWLTMGLILVGYWSIGWFASAPLTVWQDRWLQWDRLILNDWGLRAAIESMGMVFPSALEVLYMLLYAFPPACICAVYWAGGRDRVHSYLYTLMLGTFIAYALLPLFPVQGPHVAYPALDLPNIAGLTRAWNVWVLDHMDIATSVFPSGHVAVAFSAAFGLLRAVRSRPLIWGTAFGMATLVYVATIYCRYHYVADGLASIGIAGLAYVASGWRTNDV
ncbi:MAG: phosphatase PAP2 family protein [Acidobacteria bacterium]|nr:phosphatase PAP2 family protein [Acidobacteriota bacterium]